MDIEGGNSADDPIEYRELVTTYQRGENKYSNEHRMEKHFEARDPPSLRALYPDKLFPSPAAWDDANDNPPSFLMRSVFYAYHIWPPRLLHRGTILELPIHFNWAGRWGLMAKGH